MKALVSAALLLSAQLAVAQSVCPTDQEIRNMATQASSFTLGQRERAFLEEEIRRAHQCRRGQGNYTEQDWKASKEARDAQGQVLRRDRAAARRHAEGVHSAADPVEGDRIVNQRAAEAESARRRREDALRLQQQTAHPSITRCTPAGCWAGGVFYPRAAGDTFTGPTGTCRIDGHRMKC